MRACLTPNLRRAVAFTFAAGLLAQAPEGPPVGPAMVTLTDDGAFCWYQDPRAIVDVATSGGPTVLVSSVAFVAGRRGDLDVHWHQPATKSGGSFVLHKALEADDHAAAALCQRPDGRYLAVYCQHGRDQLVRWRVSERPHDASAWREEQSLRANARVTYSNLFWLEDAAGDVRLFDFVRADGFDPNWFVSDDAGDAFHYGGKLHTGPGGNEATRQRPYVRYAANGTAALHFVTTDGHPRDEDNSVYHGVLRRGVLSGSDGEELGRLSTGPTSDQRANDFTVVLRAGDTVQGTVMRHAWTLDLRVDAAGQPRAALVARADGDDHDHRFLYARRDGDEWRVRQLCRAGAFLYAAENDYTGLVALHAHDPDVVVVSTPIDPRDDQPLAHYELFLGRTADAGVSWTWWPLTWASEVDNLRPLLPDAGPQQTALLWLRGRVRTYTDWQASVVGRFVATDQLATLAVPGQPSRRRP